MRFTRLSITSSVEEPGFRCVRVCWHVVEFQPMKKLKGNSEDTVEDVEGKGQIIWCFISKGRTDRKRPALKIYAQLAGTRPRPIRYCIPLKLVMI